MTKFEFPEMSPRIFNPKPMVELEVGPGDATDMGVGEAVTGAAAAGCGARGDAVSEVDADGVDGASGVLTDEIAV
jgi:hypothetical protein